MGTYEINSSMVSHFQLFLYVFSRFWGIEIKMKLYNPYFKSYWVVAVDYFIYAHVARSLRDVISIFW